MLPHQYALIERLIRAAGGQKQGALATWRKIDTPES
jgi:hypothetical protein